MSRDGGLTLEQLGTYLVTIICFQNTNRLMMVKSSIWEILLLQMLKEGNVMLKFTCGKVVTLTNVLHHYMFLKLGKI